LPAKSESNWGRYYWNSTVLNCSCKSIIFPL